MLCTLACTHAICAPEPLPRPTPHAQLARYVRCNIRFPAVTELRSTLREQYPEVLLGQTVTVASSRSRTEPTEPKPVKHKEAIGAKKPPPHKQKEGGLQDIARRCVWGGAAEGWVQAPVAAAAAHTASSLQSCTPAVQRCLAAPQKAGLSQRTKSRGVPAPKLLLRCLLRPRRHPRRHAQTPPPPASAALAGNKFRGGDWNDPR